MQRVETTVLVIGGGPVGLTLALELGQRGIPTLVVEPRTELDPLRPRAKTTSIRTMEHFRRLKIAEAVRRRAYLPVGWSQAVRFGRTVLGPEIWRFEGVFGLVPGQDRRWAEAGQQIPQFQVEAALREAVAALPCVSVWYGWRFEQFLEREERGATAVVANAQGEARAVAARFVAAADGAQSPVRHALGIALEGDHALRPNLNAVFTCPELTRHLEGRRAVQYWTVNPEAPGHLGPLDLEGRWWTILVGIETTRVEEVVRAIHRQIGRPLPVEVLALDPWRAHMCVAGRFQSGSVFLVGDAAHLNPPYGGHGFNTGVGDAVNLGWKLAARIQGWGGEALVASYEVERRPIAQAVVQVATENMRWLAAELAEVPQGDEARLREVIRTVKAPEFYSLGLVLGYRYERSPVIWDDGTSWPSWDPVEYRPTAHPGSRLPHTWLDASTSLYDRLGPGFTLIQVAAEAKVAAWQEAASRLGLPLAIFPYHPDLEAAWREELEAPLVLVRPDQHVAWRGDDREPPEPILRQVAGLS